MLAERPRDQRQYLTFFLAGEEYAVGILEVREILEFAALTRVPGTPSFIRGVMNLRGAVVPVVDLAAKFGLPETAITKWTCIVIVDVAVEGVRTVMGVMADAVSQVIELPAEQLEPAPSFGTRVRTDFLLGMGRAGKKFVLVLDIARVLTMDELLATTDAANDGPECIDSDLGASEAPREEP